MAVQGGVLNKITLPCHYSLFGIYNKEHPHFYEGALCFFTGKILSCRAVGKRRAGWTFVIYNITVSYNIN